MSFRFKKFKHLYNAKIFLIALGVLVFSGVLIYQLAFQKKEYVTVRIKGSPGNWWWVTPRPPDWLALTIHKGDKEYNAANNPIAEVLAADVYDAGGSTRDVYLTVKLEIRRNTRTNQYRYKGEPVEIGGPISLSLKNTFFPGMVTHIYDSRNKPEKTVMKTLELRQKDRWPYEYDSLVVGDTMLDGSGEVIAKIIDKRRTPSMREGQNLNGQIVQTSSPILDDFYLTVEVRVSERGGEYVFREEQYLKVGNKIWLLFPRYNLSGADVTSIK